MQDRYSEELMGPLTTLQVCVGQKLSCVRRALFEHKGKVDRVSGALELTFEEGGPIVLDVGGDGETLTVRVGSWQDPYRGMSASPENRDWISESGQWKVFDVTRDAPFVSLVGQSLKVIKPLRAMGGSICGARMRFESLSLDFIGSSDEAFVFVPELDDIRLAKMRVLVGE